MSTLTGIKVLDFTRLLPGPYCTWLLSDLGADVTRVENPREVAKQARVFGWDKLTPDERQRIRQHDMLARDKRSIVLDIGHDRAKDVIHALAAQADVFVEDYRPGVLAGLGIGAEDLRRTNPALVTCSITLCGQTGPDRDRPGHDPLAMAMSGAMSRAGDRADRPSSLGLAVADILTGTNAALAISAALIERARTGKGKALDIAMSDAAMCLNANVLARHPDPETIPARGRRRIDCGIWRCRDGGFIATSDMEPRYWERFCQALDHPQWIPLQLDDTQHDAIAARIAGIFQTRTRTEWEVILSEAGTQYAAVLSIAEAMENAHNRARKMVVMADADGESLPQLGAPLGPTLRRSGKHRAAAAPGSDRASVLSHLDLSAEDVQNLEASGAFGHPGQSGTE